MHYNHSDYEIKNGVLTIYPASGDSNNKHNEAWIYYAGDCSGEKTASIAEAIRGGYHAANQI